MSTTTTDEVKAMLLAGRRITKLDLFNESEVHSSCLPQRIYDIRQETDWDIRSQSVKGKGTLREYWLEPEEIERIKKTPHMKRFESEKIEDEQSAMPDLNIAENGLEMAQNEKYEQIGIGLPWQNW